LILAYLIAGTDLIFNAGIKTAYFFHGLLSSNYRLTYFTEIGYYKYVEEILAAFRLLMCSISDFICNEEFNESEFLICL